MKAWMWIALAAIGAYALYKATAKTPSANPYPGFYPGLTGQGL